MNIEILREKRTVFTSNSSTSTSTEEDEDMANCLILLARGGCSEDEIKPPENKFRSRKFTQMAASDAGQVGMYVYECKTCSRTFPSFQALGGHRASHKKPKATADVEQIKSTLAVAWDEELGKIDKSGATTQISTAIQLQSPTEIKSKTHECSICGSEFSSGQALGGHMRRHRSAMNGTVARSGSDESPRRDGDDRKSRNLLALDLNMPAPMEDELRDVEFDQFSSNQQPCLVLSAAAPLVDCHY